jgi:hypothetical protein
MGSLGGDRQGNWTARAQLPSMDARGCRGLQGAPATAAGGGRSREGGDAGHGYAHQQGRMPAAAANYGGGGGAEQRSKRKEVTRRRNSPAAAGQVRRGRSGPAVVWPAAGGSRQDGGELGDRGRTGGQGSCVGGSDPWGFFPSFGSAPI